MIEFIDNLIQLLAVLSGCILTGLSYLRSRSQTWFLLCCFYGCFFLASLYWLLFTFLVTESPPVFYVADIGWISCYLFLLLLQYNLTGQKERRFQSRLAWLALLIEAPLTIYYMLIGDIFYNLIVGVLMTALLWSVIRGLVWLTTQPHPKQGRLHFLIVMLLFLGAENGLWLSSYPWAGDTPANPYFWFDFALTATLLALFPAVRKAVRS